MTYGRIVCSVNICHFVTGVLQKTEKGSYAKISYRRSGLNLPVPSLALLPQVAAGLQLTHGSHPEPARSGIVNWHGDF